MTWYLFAFEGGLAGLAEGQVHGAEGRVDVDGAHHGVAGAAAPDDVPQRPAEVLGPERDGHLQLALAFALHLRRLLQARLPDVHVGNL